MNNILLVLQREYLTRVKKRSFLLVTLLVPILIPLILGGIIYFAVTQQDSEGPRVISYYNLPDNYIPENSQKFEFKSVEGDSLSRVTTFIESGNYGLLEFKDEGYVLYARKSPSLSELRSLEGLIEGNMREKNIQSLNLSEEVISSLKPDINLSAYNIIEGKESDSGIAFAIGYAGGFLIYIFIFLYGAQVMQGVIEEKSSKIIELLISSVRPFQLMMGKVLGIAAVGFTQFFIWVVLSTVIMSAINGYIEISPEIMDQAANQGNPALMISQKVANLPIAQILIIFGFYFIGGYLLYGSLFAAIGAAVDSPSEAQQFMFPITIPLIISIIGLSITLENPDGSFSFWLSIIPFTSPVVMMGRVGFGFPPLLDFSLSVVLLILAFIGTIWVASRIYRIGILMRGTKVNYKVLAKWMMMKI